MRSIARLAAAVLVPAALLGLQMHPAAAANLKAAEACAAKLKPEAMTIYKAAAPKMTPTTDLRSLLKTVVFSLIMSGDVKSINARDSAIAAADCLDDLK